MGVYNRSITSVKELCESIWDFEIESQILSDDKYAPAWHMIRMSAYYYLAKNNNILEDPHPFERGKAWQISFLFKSIFYFFTNLKHLFRRNKYESVVVEHYRTKVVNGKGIDIYSYYYIDKNIKNNCLVFSKTLSGKSDKTDGFDRASIDFIEAFRVVFSKLICLFYRGEANKYKALSIKYFGEDITRNIAKGRVEFLITEFFYSVVFKIFSGLKELIIVDGYSSRAGMIFAAKKNKIKVLEIQHGVVTKYHLGYSYPYRNYNIKFVPDKVLAWSGFWINNYKNIFIKNVELLNENFINSEVSKYKNFEKTNSIVVVSQGAISNKLSKIIFDNHQAFKGYTVYYKLHPSEYQSWGKDENLAKLAKLKNFHIKTDADIYQLLSHAKFQVGVFSTALFEGLLLNCRLVLIDLPGIEYWDDIEVEKIDFYKWINNEL